MAEFGWEFSVDGELSGLFQHVYDAELSGSFQHVGVLKLHTGIF